MNFGGGNPGGHATLVGRHAYGFSVPQRDWVTQAQHPVGEVALVIARFLGTLGGDRRELRIAR